MTETTNNTVSKSGKLIIGDNLEVMQHELLENSIDLIYLDPPYNSNRDYYNATKGPEEKIGFDDTWNYLRHKERTDKEYERLIHRDDKLSAFLAFVKDGSVKDNNHFSYLTFMASRLIEMRRVLKPTGTIYLHVDPTESHYLKIVMDLIFGIDNFKNEIVWCYTRHANKGNAFPSLHDTIFAYSKTKNNYFNPVKRITENQEIKYARGYHPMGKNKVLVYDAENPNTKKYLEKHPDVIKVDIVQDGTTYPDYWNIPVLNTQAKERLGYPTQKPEALLERIISASCPPDGVMLDPFCGCGTSCAVAAKKGINYIGIDISAKAEDIIKQRFIDAGMPAPIIKGNSTDYYYHQKRMNRLLGLHDNNIIGADGGIDGRGMFITLDNKRIKVISQVKAGESATLSQLNALYGIICNEKADVGVFVIKKQPTNQMLLFADRVGKNKFGVDVLQILTMDEIESGKRIKLPTGVRSE